MADTTSLAELPVGPTGGENIVLERKEKNNVTFSEPPVAQMVPNLESPPQEPLSQNTISQLVSGIQHASSTGATQLPSRDIPQETLPIIQDEQVTPNYVPAPQPDYIQQHETEQSIQQQNTQKQQQYDTMDNLYDELQIPLLISVLFFLFQLPVVQKIFYRNIPSLFEKDGNASLGGLVFKSVLFGGSYYLVYKVAKNFSKI